MSFPEDKAGSLYWDQNWKDAPLPIPFDASDTSLNNKANQELHHYFQGILKDMESPKILEIGCANSIWPIYFNRYHAAEVWGLDYSETGCHKSRGLLEHYGVEGEIINGDLFQPPAELLGKFDLVVSFGVIEHFENTALCLESCAAFVKPGGKLFTLIPNMHGITGFLQKLVDRSIYDIHVPLDKKDLTDAHLNAGMKSPDCGYFMSINLGVVNSGRFSSHPLNNGFRHLLSIISKMFWLLEKYRICLPPNKFTSPYIVSHAVITEGANQDSHYE